MNASTPRKIFSRQQWSPHGEAGVTSRHDPVPGHSRAAYRPRRMAPWNTTAPTRCLVFVAACAVIGAIAAPLMAQPYSGVIAFGDSRVDTGNIYAGTSAAFPPSPPYYQGRFSNGPMWLEVYSDRLGLPAPLPSALGGSNYAWGAATTGAISNPFGVPDMDAQVGQYLATHTPSADELFVLWGGSNDYGLSGGSVSPASSVQALSAQISTLAGAGARHFLVGNLLSTGPDSSGTDWGETFNQTLQQEIAQLQTTQPELRITMLDVFGLYAEVRANPASFGFTNIVDPACSDCGIGNLPAPMNIVPNPEEYFFWDDAHFSATAQQLIGVPEPASFLWLGTALLARRSRQRCSRSRAA